ncbi:hypothetical protein ADUPG1_009220 [Aduncisulcus paluster]|uniref:Uncharacterized protein n=1 Tax=Aduncisulcus paluster TaxID=2918883 RepID=A0ABQ5KUS1_9EUKA|nr:hypothetical protein ADUPG1_009220 [Aduncisulcus paluster]
MSSLTSHQGSLSPPISPKDQQKSISSFSSSISIHDKFDRTEKFARGQLKDLSKDHRTDFINDTQPKHPEQHTYSDRSDLPHEAKFDTSPMLLSELTRSQNQYSSSIINHSSSSSSSLSQYQRDSIDGSARSESQSSYILPTVHPIRSPPLSPHKETLEAKGEEEESPEGQNCSECIQSDELQETHLSNYKDRSHSSPISVGAHYSFDDEETESQERQEISHHINELSKVEPPIRIQQIPTKKDDSSRPRSRIRAALLERKARLQRMILSVEKRKEPPSKHLSLSSQPVKETKPQTITKRKSEKKPKKSKEFPSSDVCTHIHDKDIPAIDSLPKTPPNHLMKTDLSVLWTNDFPSEEQPPSVHEDSQPTPMVALDQPTLLKSKRIQSHRIKRDKSVIKDGTVKKERENSEEQQPVQSIKPKDSLPSKYSHSFEKQGKYSPFSPAKQASITHEDSVERLSPGQSWRKERRMAEKEKSIKQSRKTKQREKERSRMRELNQKVLIEREKERARERDKMEITSKLVKKYYQKQEEEIGSIKRQDLKQREEQKEPSSQERHIPQTKKISHPNQVKQDEPSQLTENSTAQHSIEGISKKSHPSSPKYVKHERSHESHSKKDRIIAKSIIAKSKNDNNQPVMKDIPSRKIHKETPPSSSRQSNGQALTPSQSKFRVTKRKSDPGPTQDPRQDFIEEKRTKKPIEEKNKLESKTKSSIESKHDKIQDRKDPKEHSSHIEKYDEAIEKRIKERKQREEEARKRAARRVHEKEKQKRQHLLDLEKKRLQEDQQQEEQQRRSSSIAADAAAAAARRVHSVFVRMRQEQFQKKAQEHNKQSQLDHIAVEAKDILIRASSSGKVKRRRKDQQQEEQQRRSSSIAADAAAAAARRVHSVFVRMRPEQFQKKAQEHNKQSQLDHIAVEAKDILIRASSSGKVKRRRSSSISHKSTHNSPPSSNNPSSTSQYPTRLSTPNSDDSQSHAIVSKIHSHPPRSSSSSISQDKMKASASDPTVSKAIQRARSRGSQYRQRQREVEEKREWERTKKWRDRDKALDEARQKREERRKWLQKLQNESGHPNPTRRSNSLEERKLKEFETASQPNPTRAPTKTPVIRTKNEVIEPLTSHHEQLSSNPEEKQKNVKENKSRRKSSRRPSSKSKPRIPIVDKEDSKILTMIEKEIEQSKPTSSK